jgi:hypothetical protein
MASSSSLVPVAVEDHLDQDPPIRGQKFVCVSFVSPEDVLIRKDAFFFAKYSENVMLSIVQLFDNLEAKFPSEVETITALRRTYEHVGSPEKMQQDFRTWSATESEKLESEFHEANDFKTSIRGIKIRGSYDSIVEARKRAETLKRTDPNFNVFIAEVGCWCPWAPNPEDIQDQEYAETQLNTLMKKYREQNIARDIEYEERKRDLITASKKAGGGSADAKDVEEATAQIKTLLAQDDAWVEKKKADGEDEA